jgi:pyruvate decarboxylase
MAYEKVSSHQLKIPLCPEDSPNDPIAEKRVISEITKLTASANGDVVIVVDAFVTRYHVQEEVANLIKKTQFATYCG